MRKLLFLRHAKSSWKEPILDDFDRPLAPRGRKAAPKMASYMRKKLLAPELVLCSRARRAVETWELASKKLRFDGQIYFSQSLYHAEPNEIIAAIRQVPDNIACVLMIGHNPGMEDAAMALSGPGSRPSAKEKLETKFPTAALAEIEFELPGWPDIGWGLGRLVRLTYPRDLA
ncbi:MAG: histidine phosphatase family protein [Pseudomonadota bacterium]